MRNKAGETVSGSAICRNLNYVFECSNEQYLNDTSNDPAAWTCEQCPPGGACSSNRARWSRLEPLFGWWKVPPRERAGNASWKTTLSFIECFYPPACLGAPHVAMAGRFYSESGVDLAMVGKHKDVNSTCATTLGFRNTSRLCHMCNETSRRERNSRCVKCPTSEQNLGLIVAGIFVVLVLLVFIVGSRINDAGMQTLSSGIQKIILNYLQVAALAQAFPLRWPPVVESLF